jgi:hypothetical protein
LELVAQDALPESHWWKPGRIDFAGTSLDFQIKRHSGTSARVSLYAADYIIAPKNGNDATGPYLPPDTIRGRFPQGFSVSIAKFPGWNGHLAVGGSGETFYERLIAETAAGGILYVSNAHRPKPHFVLNGFLRTLYCSHGGIPEEVARGDLVLYEKLHGKDLSSPEGSGASAAISSTPE